MTTFILVPGAGGVAWYWHRLVPLLEHAGHAAVAVDLPGDDDSVGLDGYAQRIAAAIGERRDVVLVAQSLAGFVAPMVCARAPVQQLVLVNAMIPTPGERAGAWGDHTGSTAARTAAARAGGYSEDFDEAVYFFHDVPPAVRADGESHQRQQSERVFRDTADFTAWPAIPIHVIAGADDRLFPLEFQRRVARERLGDDVDVDVVAGGHLIALSNPDGLADQLLAYVR